MATIDADTHVIETERTWKHMQGKRCASSKRTAS